MLLNYYNRIINNFTLIWVEIAICGAIYIPQHVLPSSNLTITLLL